jgi:hypothetical protein
VGQVLTDHLVLYAAITGHDAPEDRMVSLRSAKGNGPWNHLRLYATRASEGCLEHLRYAKPCPRSSSPRREVARDQRDRSSEHTSPQGEQHLPGAALRRERRRAAPLPPSAQSCHPWRASATARIPHPRHRPPRRSARPSGRQVPQRSHSRSARSSEAGACRVREEVRSPSGLASGRLCQVFTRLKWLSQRLNSRLSIEIRSGGRVPPTAAATACREPVPGHRRIRPWIP